MKPNLNSLRMICVPTQLQLESYMKELVDYKFEVFYEELNKLFQRILKIEENQKCIELAYETKKWKK